MDFKATVAPYPGGKYHLAPLLNSLMVGKRRHISGFGGMANEFLSMAPHETEIYNDINNNLCHLFSCLNDGEKREALFDKILEIPYTKKSFDKIKKELEKGYINQTDFITYGAWVWFAHLTSRNGSGDSYNGEDLENENLKDDGFKRIFKSENQFHNYICKKWYALSRFDNVIVWNKDIFSLLDAEKDNPEGSDTFYFMDSPYLENNAGYDDNMKTSKKHEPYCHAIGKLKGAVMVCGYDKPIYKLYDDILGEYGFSKIILKERPVTMETTEKGGRKRRETECIWINY